MCELRKNRMLLVLNSQRTQVWVGTIPKLWVDDAVRARERENFERFDNSHVEWFWRMRNDLSNSWLLRVRGSSLYSLRPIFSGRSHSLKSSQTVYCVAYEPKLMITVTMNICTLLSRFE